jgi:hypothetical protein
MHVQRLLSIVKMASVLEECNTEELLQLCVFTGDQRTRCKGYSWRNVSVYGGKCLLCKAVHNCVEKFSQGHSKLADDAWPGHPFEIATEATVQWVEELIQTDRRIMIDSAATALGCSHGFSMQHDPLKYQKVYTQYVPRAVRDWGKMNCMVLSLQHLLWCADEGEDVLNRIVTWFESWVHHYHPKSKCASM